jgi:molybdopterin/thiamine biosynthesis adenylyltransferase
LNSRYLRQIKLAEFGSVGQKKLTDAEVLVVGIGGLGCPALQYLACSGVGKLVLMDDDLIDITNLGRQILFSPDDIGSPKVEVAKIQLQRLNPDIKIETRRERFCQKNARELVRHADVVLDGSDNFTTKYLINDACVLEKTPFCHGGVLKWSGSTFTYTPGSPCLRCLFEDSPETEDIPNCSEVGTLGPVAGIIANIQATEVIKILCGAGKPLSGSLMSIDAHNMQARRIHFPIKKNCAVCGEQPSITDAIEQGVQQPLSKDDAFLVTFEGQHQVIKAERHLKNRSYNVEARVTPRQLSHECGICLEVCCSSREELQATLSDANLIPSRLGRKKELS